MRSSPRPFVPNFCFLLARLAAAVALSVYSFASAYDAHPKLVVVIVIDQFRGDYLDRYRDQLGDAGFRLFLDHGAYFLNYNIYAPTNPTYAGDFPGDVQFPGLPGTNGSLLNFAMEAITYLHLTPGTYTFGVNSDDGFRLTSAALQLGVFDAGRGAADPLFSFAVTQAGYCPFRLVYFQGTGAASLEWFSVTPAGQKILINDTNTPGYIAAYRRATTSLPYFLGSWPGGTGNRPDQPVRVQMQDGAGIKVNTNSIHLTLNGLSVAPSITQTGGVTTVQYTTVW